jgi:DNA (cytosine-5)-methyltransferase 1
VRLRPPGLGIYEEHAPTLDATAPHNVASTVAARDFKSATDLVATSWTPAIAGPLDGAAQTGGFSTTDFDNNGAYIVEPVPFDTTQVTSIANRSNPRHGDPCHPLARGGHAPAIAFQWPVEVADPISAHEQHTYTHEGTTFRLHNVVPDVVAFQSNLGSQGGDVNVEHTPTGVFLVNGNSTPEVGFELAFPLRANDGSGNRQVFAFDPYNQTVTGGVTHPLRVGTGNGHEDEIPQVLAAPTMAVRRLTPRECERLQGFPDEWTAITYRGKPASDGPRYKALGNSMACNVMRWIGQRIANHEAINA